MGLEVKKIEYYNLKVNDNIMGGYKVLSVFAAAGISWFAFKAVPVDGSSTAFSLFPDDCIKFVDTAQKAGLGINGPYSALLIKGDEKGGALSVIYEKLAEAAVTVNQSSGIADINKGYGVILYLNQQECDKAIAALVN